ncbi:MAG: hypothetical protein JO063_15330, partial [Pseudonocardiales bacterium]|nr:hypothetical protein [Pseudonocardiales bacterium]
MRQLGTTLVLPAVAAGIVILAGCGGPAGAVPGTAVPGTAVPAPVSAGQAMPGMSMLPAGAPGAAAGPAAPVATDAVSIQNFAFSPATVTIRTGTTLTWTNRDQDPHTVSAMSGAFHSPTLNTGQSYQHTFTT